MNFSNTLTAKEAVYNSLWNYKKKDRYHFWMFWSKEGMKVSPCRFTYRKPIHTNRCFKIKSHHHPRIKASIVKCLAHKSEQSLSSKYTTARA